MKDKNPLKHQARKRFGQNFLVDHGIIRHIVRAIGPSAKDNIVEIGPGQGAITASLLEANPNLNVIELDRDLIPILKVKFDTFPGLSIHQQDALSFDFKSLVSDERKLRVVGNLPYNISTPLIFHLLASHEIIADMHFMLQKEVVLRLAAKPGDKNYGRLSIMAQYFCETEALFDVPPECFDPAPKVTSAIVRLSPYETLPATANDEKLFASVVKHAFSQRRKTLRNALKPLIEGIDPEQLDIDLSKRAEQISTEKFVALSNQLHELIPT